MRWSSLLLACTFAVTVEGVLLRGHAESLEVSMSSNWAALDLEVSEAEAEDRSFLLSQIDQTESQLLKLQQLTEAGSKFAALQLSAAPTDKKATPAVKEEAKKEAAPAKPEAVTKTAAKEAAKPEAKEETEDPMKMLGSLGINLGSVKGMKGTAALAPMLGMLKGLYQDSKERISQQNQREEKSKKWFTEKEADHKAKLETIEAKFANHTLSEEFRTNETRDENRYFNYWQRVRERQHRQFHTNLKIQHAMMTKTKKMVDMYEKALSPKEEDQAAAKKMLSAQTGMPEIVFLQDVQRTVGKFCRDSLAEVRKEKAELQEYF